MRYVLSLLLLLSLTTLALAQEMPKVEVFGGYSALFADIKDYDRDAELDGWNASVAYNLHPNFGIKADFGGHYNKKQDVGSGQTINSTHISYLFGPQLTHRGNRFSFYAHALIGGVRNSYSNLSEDGFIDSTTETKNGFGAAIGGGIDLNLNKKIAIRLIQLDSIWGRYKGEYYARESDSYRYSRGAIGVVFKFGK